MKITTWRLDTCGCEIEYEWDETKSEDARIHSLNKVKVACPVHASLSGTDLYNTVVDENQNKNKGVAKLAELLNISDENISNINWKFDASRNILFKSPVSLTGVQKTTVENELSKISNKLKLE